MDKPKFYTWTVKFRIHNTWIADGFDLTPDRAFDMLARALPHARMGSELFAEVVASPDPDEVAREMGYRDAAHRGKK